MGTSVGNWLVVTGAAVVLQFLKRYNVRMTEVYHRCNSQDDYSFSLTSNSHGVRGLCILPWLLPGSVWISVHSPQLFGSLLHWEHILSGVIDVWKKLFCWGH